MDFAQLKTSLKSQVSPAYLFYGTDHFLIYKALSLVQNAWPDAEFTKFAASTPVSEVLSAVQSTAFFASRRIVAYEVEAKTNVALLNEYLKKPLADSVLLLLSFGEKNVTKLKNVVEVNCNPLPEDLLVKLIAKQIAPHTITFEAAHYLVAATGGDYSQIDHELTKLLAFYHDLPTWQEKDLVPYLNKTVDYQIYELGNAILAGQTATAATICQELLAGSSADYAVFGGLAAQLRRVFYATATTGSEGAVAAVLGCSPYAIKYSRRDFRTRQAMVRAKYQQILNLEFKIKSGQISVVNALAVLIYH